jgi:hypothetical protein
VTAEGGTSTSAARLTRRRSRLGVRWPVVVRPRQPTACRPTLRRRSTAGVKTVRRGALEGRRGTGNAMAWSVRVEGGWR